MKRFAVPALWLAFALASPSIGHAQPCPEGGTVFDYTGALQEFTVPEGVSTLDITAVGAGGGTSLLVSQAPGYAGGFGAAIGASFPVTEGEVLQVLVGGKGADAGHARGGGGGGSFVYRTPLDPMSSLLIVGGGGGSSRIPDESHGSLTEAAGIGTGTGPGTPGTGGNGGTGSTGTFGGGGGGGAASDGGPAFGTTTTGGMGLVSGGAGGTGGLGGNGGYGGGGAGGGTRGAAGGGYNGGAAGGQNGSGGGGGSYVHASATPISAELAATIADGQVAICYDLGPAPLCPESPSICDGSGVSKLLFAGNEEPTRQKMSWKWSAGTADVADFGDPLDATSYPLCIYEDAVLVMSAEIAAGGTCGSKPCWKDLGGKGFGYKNKEGNAAGVTGVTLKAGNGKASIALKGKGGSLQLPLPITDMSTVTVQLLKDVDSGSECWEAVFEAPAGKNTPLKFSDKLP